MTVPDDYYELIKMPSSASDEEVREALRRAQRQWGKRATVGNTPEIRAEAEAMVRALSRAKLVLDDPEARSAYDRERAPGVDPSHSSEPRRGIFPRQAPQAPRRPDPQPMPQPFPRSAPGTFPPPPPMPPPPSLAPPPPPSLAPPVPRPGPAPPGPPPNRRQPDRGRPRPHLGAIPLPRNRALRWGVVLLVGYILLRGIANSFGGSPSTDTSGSGSSGSSGPPASAPAVLGVVASALRSCAHAAVATPANCPQQVSVANPAALVWALHGDPTAGAEVGWDGGKATVTGHAVYTVRYSQSETPAFQVLPTPYRAIVAWNDGKPALTALGAPDVERPPVTEPRPAVLTDDAVRRAVAAFLDRCAATTSARQGAQCPAQAASVDPRTAGRWQLTSDPLLNSAVTYDDGYGIVHVVGSYTMTFSYADPQGAQQQSTASGNYDASVTADGHDVVVVQVKTA
jgi:hypothetical protein